MFYQLHLPNLLASIVKSPLSQRRIFFPTFLFLFFWLGNYFVWPQIFYFGQRIVQYSWLAVPCCNSVYLYSRAGRWGKFEIIMWMAIFFMYLTNRMRLQCFKTFKSWVLGHGFAVQIVRDGNISPSKYFFQRMFCL